MHRPEWAQPKRTKPRHLAKAQAVANPYHVYKRWVQPHHLIAYWRVHWYVTQHRRRLIYKPLNNRRLPFDKATLKAIDPYLRFNTFLFHQVGKRRFFIGVVLRPTRINWLDKRTDGRNRWRPRWRFNFRRTCRKKFPFQPDVWFLTFPHGGTIVLPACVFPPGWRKMRLPKFSPGFWPWKFWERWDILDTLPDLPADLVWQDESVPLPVKGEHVSVPAHVTSLEADVELVEGIVGEPCDGLPVPEQPHVPI